LRKNTYYEPLTMFMHIHHYGGTLPFEPWNPNFRQNRSRGFRATEVRILGSPIDLVCRPYNSLALSCWLWCRNCGRLG